MEWIPIRRNLSKAKHHIPVAIRDIRSSMGAIAGNAVSSRDSKYSQFPWCDKRKIQLSTLYQPGGVSSWYLPCGFRDNAYHARRRWVSTP